MIRRNRHGNFVTYLDAAKRPEVGAANEMGKVKGQNMGGEGYALSKLWEATAPRVRPLSF